MIPFFAVGIAAAFSPVPEPIIEPARIAALIHDLDADEFRARDRATKELRAIGLPALEALKQAEREFIGFDARERCSKLAREIRMESTNGGKPMAGLQITLRCDRDVFRADEPIRMQLEICNRSHVCKFHHAGGWVYSLTYGPERHLLRRHVSDVSRLYASDGRVELHQMSGMRMKTKTIHSHPQVVGVIDRDLKPGEAYHDSIEIGRIGALMPGAYEVRFSFDCYLSARRTEKVESNTVRFTIE